MRKRGLKKIVAASLAVALSFGGLQFTGGEVEAAVSAQQLRVDNLTDQTGFVCSFIAEHGRGNDRTYAESGNAQGLFDNNTTTKAYTVRSDGDLHQEGNYVGIVYATEMHVTSVQFVFGNDINNRCHKAKLQYLNENDEWVDIGQEGCSYTASEYSSDAADRSIQDFSVTLATEVATKGIRLYCEEVPKAEDGTAHQTNFGKCWIELNEIKIGKTEDENAPVHSVAAEVSQDSMSLGTANVSETSVNYGSSVTFTAAPNENARFVEWVTEDGTLVTRDASFQTVVKGNLHYYAKFRPMYSGTENIARSSTVELTTGTQEGGEISLVKDGQLSDFYAYYQNSKDTGGETCLTLDFGKVYKNIDCVKMLRYYSDSRTYGPTIIELSKDAGFTNKTTIYNSNKGRDAKGNNVTWTSEVETGTEAMYAETSTPHEFTVPVGVEARYMRVYTNGQNSASNGVVHVIEIEVWAVTEQSIIPSVDITPTASGYFQNSEEPGKANDGDTNTQWCTDTTKPNKEFNGSGFWLDYQFESRMVDGVKVYLNNEKLSAGYIKGYDIYVKTPKNDDYTKVCAGTWTSDAAGWEYAKFEPVEATNVRLVATNTSAYDNWSRPRENELVIVKEMQVTVPETDFSFFKGGSLRMDYTDTYDKTCIRFGYEIPETFNDMTVEPKAWSWNYGVTPAVTKNAKAEKYVLKDGIYSSNIVFTGVTSNHYTDPIYTQLVVNYSNTDNEKLNVFCNVENRTVKYVADVLSKKPVDENIEKDVKQKAYVDAILRTLYDTPKVGTSISSDTVSAVLFDGTVTASLYDCAYTFEYVEMNENQPIYKISADIANGESSTKVYLQAGATPNVTTEKTIKIIKVTDASGEVVANKFKLYDTAKGKHLHFFNNTFKFDQCATSCGDPDIFEIWKLPKSASASTSFADCVQVKNLTEFNSESGTGKYLIMRKIGNDYYLVHPTTASNAYSQVVKMSQR